MAAFASLAAALGLLVVVTASAAAGVVAILLQASSFRHDRSDTCSARNAVSFLCFAAAAFARGSRLDSTDAHDRCLQSRPLYIGRIVRS